MPDVRFQNCVGLSAATAAVQTASAKVHPNRRIRPSPVRAAIRRFAAKLAWAALAAQCAWAAPVRADPVEIKIGVLRQVHSRETISILDIPASDDFVAGVKMALEDNNTTGSFIDQSFSLAEAKIGASEDPGAKLDALLAQGVRLFVVDLPPDKLLAVADRAKDALVFNAGAPDERLREADCRANLFHTSPSRAMLADGLAQYLMWKQWRRWFLVVGSHPEDKLLGEAYARAARKFGAKIVETRTFEDTGGGRRSDTGVVQVQRQMPVATQKAPDYDVLIAADENEVFAGYLPYRNWDARPVAGSAGLMPTSWDPSHELWGAAQLQNRFFKSFRRGMTARDNQAWTAARMIGEAAAHTKSADPRTLRDFLRSADFEVADFKGQRLTLRLWNQQLRQPILLTDGRGTVSVSPQEGYLHQVSELDTLGLDQPETKCKLP